MLFHQNGGFTRIELLRTGHTVEVPTELIPFDLRKIGSRFFFAFRVIRPDYDDSPEIIRQAVAESAVVERMDDAAINDPSDALPLGYQPKPPATTASRGMKTAGLILMLIGAAGFVCTIVGITLAFRAMRTSPSPTPAQLSMGISRSLCFSMVRFIFCFVGFALRFLGSRMRRNR